MAATLIRSIGLGMGQSGEDMKRSYIERKTGLHRNAKLCAVSDDDSPEVKRRIQVLLRDIAIAQDGGCVLRFYPEADNCGGYRKDGQLILQAEHLVTRKNSVSYADMRNIVCL